MGWAEGGRNLVFYIYDRRISVRDHKWVQDALLVTVDMFHRMGLEVNLDKTKLMICTPGFIWGGWREIEYKRRTKGYSYLGYNYRVKT